METPPRTSGSAAATPSRSETYTSTPDPHAAEYAGVRSRLEEFASGASTLRKFSDKAATLSARQTHNTAALLTQQLEHAYEELKAREDDLRLAGQIGQHLLTQLDERYEHCSQLEVKLGTLEEEREKEANLRRRAERQAVRDRLRIEELEMDIAAAQEETRKLQRQVAERGAAASAASATQETLASALERAAAAEEELGHMRAETARLNKLLRGVRDELAAAREETREAETRAAQMEALEREAESLRQLIAKFEPVAQRCEELQWDNKHMARTVQELTEALRLEQEEAAEMRRLLEGGAAGAQAAALARAHAQAQAKANARREQEEQERRALHEQQQQQQQRHQQQHQQQHEESGVASMVPSSSTHSNLGLGAPVVATYADDDRDEDANDGATGEEHDLYANELHRGADADASNMSLADQFESSMSLADQLAGESFDGPIANSATPVAVATEASTTTTNTTATTLTSTAVSYAISEADDEDTEVHESNHLDIPAPTDLNASTLSSVTAGISPRANPTTPTSATASTALAAVAAAAAAAPPSPRGAAPATTRTSSQAMVEAVERRIANVAIALDGDSMAPRTQEEIDYDAKNKEFFFLLCLAIKLNTQDIFDEVNTLSSRQLYLKARAARVQFHEYVSWIERELSRAYIERLYSPEAQRSWNERSADPAVEDGRPAGATGPRATAASMVKKTRSFGSMLMSSLRGLTGIGGSSSSSSSSSAASPGDGATRSTRATSSASPAPPRSASAMNFVNRRGSISGATAAAAASPAPAPATNPIREKASLIARRVSRATGRHTAVPEE